jgi:hypothetical protein
LRKIAAITSKTPSRIASTEKSTEKGLSTDVKRRNNQDNNSKIESRNGMNEKPSDTKADNPLSI